MKLTPSLIYSKSFSTELFRRILQAFRDLGGRFTISDDAHKVDQVGLNYHRVLDYVKSLGIEKVHYLERLPAGEIAVDTLEACAVRSISVELLEKEPFWTLMAQRDAVRDMRGGALR